MGSTTVEEEGKLHINSNSQLSFKILDLFIFRTMFCSIVIEAYLSECYRVGRGFGFESQGAKLIQYL